jgi:hypothetical protein
MTTLDVTAPAATVRQERLSSRVSVLRGRAGLGDRWMLLIGGFLLPLGVLLVLLGWKGAAETPLPFEQTSYLISGGLLGLALVFAGGFIYFGYWLTLLVRETRAGRHELVAVLSRMEQLLSEGAIPQTARLAVPAGVLVATRTGTMYHRTDCVVVDGKDALRTVTADMPGLTPCKLCDPA